MNFFTCEKIIVHWPYSYLVYFRLHLHDLVYSRIQGIQISQDISKQPHTSTASLSDLFQPAHRKNQLDKLILDAHSAKQASQTVVIRMIGIGNLWRPDTAADAVSAISETSFASCWSASRLVQKFSYHWCTGDALGISVTMIFLHTHQPLLISACY